MGFRFRKSFNFGPLRINMSKSGLGWSIGGKGARYTKKANGGSRSTFSLPGTGLSYVTEINKKKQVKGNNKMPEKIMNEEIENTNTNSDKINVPFSWISDKLNLTPRESDLFLTIFQNFLNKSFTQRDVAAQGCAVSTSIYTNLYNKNILNKNEDKTYSLNVSFINKLGEEYQRFNVNQTKEEYQYSNIKYTNKKGHSIILHFLFGWMTLYIPTIYFIFSKKHYWHI